MPRKFALAIITIFLFGVSAAAVNSAKAQIYFGDVNNCLESPAVDCPFGTEKQKESSVGDTALTGFSCIPKVSNFCALVTGSPLIAHKGGDNQYCIGEPLASVGRCDPSDKVTSDLLGGPGEDRWRFVYNNTSGNGKLMYDQLKLIINNPGAKDFYNTDQGRSSVREDLHCLKIEKDGRDQYRVRVPRLSDKLDVSNEYDTIGNVSRISKAVDFGLVIDRDDSTPRFCEDKNAVYVRPEGRGDDGGVCYTGIGGRPCLIPSIRGGGSACVAGISPNARISGNFIPIFKHYDDPKDSFSRYIVVTANTNFCQRNSKDMLENSTSKGCSDYLEVRDADNGLQYRGTKAYNEAQAAGVTGDELKRLANVVEDSKKRYADCLKCLYGNDGNFKNAPGTPEHNIREGDPKAVDASGNPIAKITSGAISPDNEYFAVPLQGRFYNDLSCVNASTPNSIVNTILRCALAIMALLVVIRIMQGVLYMQQTSGFDPERVQEGRDIIISALVAMLVLILSGVLLNFLGVNILNLGGQGFAPFT